MNSRQYFHFKVAALLILLISAGWIWISRVPTNAAQEERAVAPRQGFMAPDFTLPTINGDSYSLADWRGHPVVLNFWASWCLPCRAEMPALERVYQHYKERGLLILGINAASQDSRQAALVFINENKFQFPILFDDHTLVYEMYAVRALPTTFFITAQGQIQEVIVGGPISEALLRVQIEKLLVTSKGDS